MIRPAHVFAFVLGGIMIAYGLSGCTTTDTGKIQLTGKADDIFREVAGHRAVTLSDKVVIYGTEDPPSETLKCHEERGHGMQAKTLGDALVNLGYIDDDGLSRMAAWVAIYSIVYAQYGYNNRFEQEARALCKQ